MVRLESEQREKILVSAVEVFADKGFKGSTIRSLAKAAGVNSALIYYYFENKDTLFAEAVEMVMRGFLTQLATDKRSFSGARDRLDYLVKSLLDYYNTYADRRRLMIIALTMHPDLFARGMSNALREQRPAPIDILMAGMAAGEIRPAHPVSVWLYAVGLCMFSFLVSDIFPRLGPMPVPLPATSLEDRRQQIVDLLLKGVAAEKCQGAGVE